MNNAVDSGHLPSGIVRPRAASVAAVVWLYLGPAWVLFGMFGLCNYFTLLSTLDELSHRMGTAASTPSIPSLFLWFPAGALLIGAGAAWGALRLLKLEERGRRITEYANWAAVAVIMLFTLSWMDQVTTTTSYFGYSRSASWPQVQMALLGLLVGLLTSTPFFVLGRKLRSVEVRQATRGVGPGAASDLFRR